MRKIYVSGEFVAECDAKVSIFDRGFLMADAVYEGIAVIQGKLCDYEGHMTRLARSLKEMKFDFDPVSFDFLGMLRELVAVNALDEGFIYLQVTRGEAERDFAIEKGLSPSIVAFTQAKKLANSDIVKRGMKVVTREDMRWGRCDVKTTQLLWASLMKTEAVQAGADDVWLTSGYEVLEGSSNNAFIVKNNTIVTRPTSRDILPGITRRVLLELCEGGDYQLEERVFSVVEAQNADEAFATAASSWVVPVIEIDGVKIGSGTRGPVAEKLHELYVANAIKTSV